jgi:hypothetical protein
LIARIAKVFTFSNVVAVLALFMALGGSVYAAGKINGKQVKQSSLPGNRIKPKTIPPNRITPKSLTGRQVKANSLKGAQIDEKSLVGVNAAGLASVQYQVATVSLPGNGRSSTATANCPPGSYVLGGGATLSSDNQASVNSGGPSALRTGWTATVFSWVAGSTMTVTAICVAVEKPGGTVHAVQYQPGS